MEKLKNKNLKGKILGEREDFEIKSEFYGTEKEWLRLIKTIVAMANKKGGVIKIKKVNNVKFSDFDPANLDNKVNSYIAPKLRGIKSIKKRNSVVIKIKASELRPHIFIKRGIYKNEKGNEVTEFYEGQIWIRHSAKNELFDKSDFDLIVQEEMQKLLDRMNILVAQYPISKLETSEFGMPMKIKPIKNKKRGVPVVIEKQAIDPNIAYPYQAKDLAKLLDKSPAYVVKLLEILKMKGDPKYGYDYKNSNGKVILRKYNDECLDSLRKFISERPNFNPWHEKI